MGEVSMTEMAGEVLTAAAVETITRSGARVAGRAGGHRPTLPRAPHDFADSNFLVLTFICIQLDLGE